VTAVRSTTWPRVTPFGEFAFLVELGDTFDDALAARARAIADRWDLGPAIPAYTSVVLSFDPTVDGAQAESLVAPLLRTDVSQAAARAPARLVEIPTRYDGPDLADVAAMSKISTDELIVLHSGREYLAYFLGFLPGWAYCGRLDPRIVATRLDRPREHVPAGSVGVVDGQTGVYPYRSPGGWRLIGSTDEVMFDPARERPSLISPGDHVRFVPR
jgi:KipI family sensor histidine kinase inhibitor